MKTCFAATAAVLTLAVAVPLAAQDPRPGDEHSAHGAAAEGPPLTLDAAIDEALANNLTLVRLRLEFERARTRRQGEGFLMPPTLEAQIWQWPVTSVNPLDTNMYMFTLRQEIPGRGKRALQATAAERDVDIADNQIGAHAREVIAAVQRAYAELAISRQAIAIHLAHVDLLRQTATLTTERYAAGTGEQQDALKAAAEISKLHGDLIALEARAQQAAAELNVLLNRPPQQPVGEVAVAPPWSPLPPLEELQAQALQQHPDLYAADLGIQRAEADVAIANEAYRPDFMVMGGYQLMPHTAGAWTAGFGITWPGAPWARGALDARKAATEQDVNVARARQRETAAAIKLAIQQAYLRATSAAERAHLIESTVLPQLRQVVDASRVAYVADRASASSLVDNQRVALDAQLDYLNALSDAAQAHVDLERAVGVALSEVPR